MSAQPTVSLRLSATSCSQKKSCPEALTLTVVAEGHLGLAKANRVLARSDAIELLEFSLVDALQEKC